MPARSKEERERRRQEFEERKAARKAAKNASGTHSSSSTATGSLRSDGPADANDSKQVDLSKLSPEEANATSVISQLSSESVHQLFSFMAGRELGGMTLTCRLLNYALKEGRIQHLLSRLKNGRRRETDAATVSINMLENESEARELLDMSLGSRDDDTGRLRTKKSKRKGADCGADEYVAYARFLESAVSGYEVQCSSPVLPSCVNGRFVSVSPEHSLSRVGGGDNSGGGSGAMSWGVGGRGALGHGAQGDHLEPTRLMMGIGYGIRVVQCSAGGGLVRVAHSLLLTATGRVLSFGCASHGQLGHGFSAKGVLHDEFRPKYIEALAGERIICVSAGELHSAAVNADGDVYTWGEGFCGQLGHYGDKRPQMGPKQISSGGLEDEVVASVSCGARHTLFVTEDGEVFSTGLGHFGVLGRSYTPFEYDADAAVSGFAEDLSEEEAAEATQATAAAAPAQDENNAGISEETRAHLDLLGSLTLDDASDQCYPVIIDSLQGIKIIGASAGHRHSMVLDDKGRLYSFGTGTAGCLGHGDCLKQSFPVMIQEFAQNDISIINFSAGVDISMAVSSGGNVYSWGKTDGGRIGLGGDAKTSILIPRRVALPGDGSAKAVDVDCAYVHSLIVGLDGSVYQCGGVGVDGADDGQNLDDEFSADEEKCGRPVKLKSLNIWHRTAEPKPQKSTERWKKYGSYEVKGRANMMGAAEK